jgi:hypothetical protein
MINELKVNLLPHLHELIYILNEIRLTLFLNLIDENHVDIIPDSKSLTRAR